MCVATEGYFKPPICDIQGADTNKEYRANVTENSVKDNFGWKLFHKIDNFGNFEVKLILGKFRSPRKTSSPGTNSHFVVGTRETILKFFQKSFITVNFIQSPNWTGIFFIVESYFQ